MSEFDRLRVAGEWYEGRPIRQSELEAIDDLRPRVPNLIEGSTHAPTSVVIIGGVGIKASNTDVQAFTSTGADTWTKPSWANDATPVRAFVVPGGASGSGGGGSNSGGGGAGSIPVIGEYFAGDLAATEAVNVGAGGATSQNNGNAGGTSTFATGKAYATVASAPSGGLVSGGHGGSGGNGGGSGSVGGSGNGGTGGHGGGPGTAADDGTPGTAGTGALNLSGLIGACGTPGAGGAINEGGNGGVGWGAGGGGGAAVDADITGGGGGGAGWTGYQGYPTAGDGEDRDGSVTDSGAGAQGIVVVVTG